jgi:hypothetical protein
MSLALVTNLKSSESEHGTELINSWAEPRDRSGGLTTVHPEILKNDMLALYCTVARTVAQVSFL